MKKVLIIVSWLVGIGTFGALMAFEHVAVKNTMLMDIAIELEQPEDQFFINKEDVMELLLKADDSLKTRSLPAINTDLLEESLKDNPFVSEAEVFSTLDGLLSVHVKQKEAVARVLNPSRHYYLDAEGHPYPTTLNHSARVPVITGVTDSVSIYNAYKVLSAINNEPYFNGWLAEINIHNNGAMELIPRSGKHRVLFGRNTNVTSKLKRLYAFYTHVVTPQNLNTWKTLNVIYKDQLISTKHAI
jgi:cell division protein FtsQ